MYYNSAGCPSSLPDTIFLVGGACESAKSIRCINGSAAEVLQWPYSDCSGVPAVFESTVFPPPCYPSKGAETDICVSAPALAFPVRRAGFVNFYSRDNKGEVCDFPPVYGESLNILIPLDKCVRDVLLPGIAKTYSCSAAGLTVTTFSQELCSRSTPPTVVTYPTDECLVNAYPSLSGAWLISCPEPEPPVPPVPPPQAAASNAGLIGGLVVGGLIIAAAGGFFLWTRRASLFAGANVMNGASQKAPMGSVYAALDSRASEM